ncbi:methionyl-tRNA formyltransferase [Nodosilinea sp. LEGE 07088]|uniref:methionyl-tRNA formyltransferase n=1 Tax=Nodosilinea sp. LEGE 07088 TaxID=2777968 RepID=UPI00187FF772|nr:methionyl-tRNA formyltransferase [Nodosilinea sp. LEGE 07088]MBE9136698.1 methionyl-tRNA formyltransferase [Nodosilinea sp. LEGE 07088]
MRLVFFGTPQFAVPSLERLLAEPGFEVVAVVTQPDRRRGRGKAVDASPVKQAATNCPVLQPLRIKKDAATLTALNGLRADAFVVVAYGQLLSQRILDMPRWGCINGHGSLLPAYRGAAPIQWCIVNGETATGMTTMKMNLGMDTGDMLLRSHWPIGLLDTAEDVAAALSQQCADLLVETLHGLQAGTLTPMPQDEARATYAPLIQKQDFELDWSKPAIALHNQVRGFYPNGVTTFRDQPLKVMATAPLVDPYWAALPPELVALRDAVAAIAAAHKNPAPGTLVGWLKGHGPLVQTSEGLLLLRRVKPMGKQAQAGSDFVNGSRLQVGEVLGSLPADQSP